MPRFLLLLVKNALKMKALSSKPGYSPLYPLADSLVRQEIVEPLCLDIFRYAVRFTEDAPLCPLDILSIRNSRGSHRGSEVEKDLAAERIHKGI